MKGQGCPGDAQLLAQLRRRKAFGPPLDEQSEESQAGFLGQRGQHFDGIHRFHISKVIEMNISRQFRSLPVPKKFGHDLPMRHFAELDSPIGPLRLISESGLLTQLQLRPESRSALLDAGWREDARVEPLAVAAIQLREYFDGRRRVFDLPLRLSGSAFQSRVWRALQQIPFGITASYGDIATCIGSAGSSRAVGLANNRNPIAIIVPCHRVINADGSLGGFGGGVPMKDWLLRHEGAAVGAQQSLPWEASASGSDGRRSP
jgi:methylated-DNA-[protein]-cysteine S-methyltransferase